MSIYETDTLLHQYLLFHYGTAEQQLPAAGGPTDALDFPVRCVTELLDPQRLSPRATALDLGCAVGRSAFELARTCHHVTAVDLSSAFIETAQSMQQQGELTVQRLEEGVHTRAVQVSLPRDLPRDRIVFEQGDATRFPTARGPFDVVLMANLLDRVPDPAACLARAAHWVRPGGQLLLTTPFTWLEEFTPASAWLGGRPGDSQPSREGLAAALAPAFELDFSLDLPFLIREHARKYQWSLAYAARWTRRKDPCPND